MTNTAGDDYGAAKASQLKGYSDSDSNYSRS